LAQAEKKQTEVYLSIVNYGEVIYITEREHGLTAAQSLIAAVDQLPVTVVEADRKLTFAAAHLKAHHSISYADAFALALAQQEQAILLTGDPEFQQVASLAAIEWLPQA
jgi:ribonuclease VapC